MRELFVNDNTFDKLWIFDRSASFCNNFDQIKVNISSVQISDFEDSFDSEISIVLLALADNFWTKCGSSTLSEVFVIIFWDINLFLNVIDFLHSDITSALKSISNFERMDAFVKELLCLLKDGSSKHNNTGSSVTNLIILGGWELS